MCWTILIGGAAMATKEPRGRNFAMVQKIENLPVDWREILKGKLIPCCYVVHDKDVDEEGMPIDPHVHIFVYFAGKRAASGVVAMFSELNVGYAEKIECKNAYLAYMLHIEQKGKHRYDYDEMIVLNGLKVNFADLTSVDFGDVMKFIDEYNICRFSELLKAARYKEPPIFRYVTGHYGLVCAYFTDEREGTAEDDGR